MKWVRRLLWLVAGVAGLLVGGLLIIWAVTSTRMAKTYHVPAKPVMVASDSASIARGRHLAVAVAKCTECHGDDLGGQILTDDFMFGRLASANLTPAGLGTRYDDATLARAIRHGLNPQGKPLLFMPSEAFQYLSDDDVGALVGYIRSVPPVNTTHPKPRIGPVPRIISLFTTFPLISARMVNHDLEPPRSMPEDSSVAYGKYLANVGGCTGCHGPGLSGGKVGPGKPASNLTPAGIGTWTEQDFFRALREGKRPVGAPIDSVDMPWKRSGLMTDLEIRAVWAFIKSMPPKEFGKR